MWGLSQRVRDLATAVSILAPVIGPQASGASPCERVGFDPPPVVLQDVKGPVRGTPYQVPDLHIRFSDAKTGSWVTPKLVEVTFSWSEPRGFRDTRFFLERLTCRPRAGDLTVPGFEISPQSWQLDWRWFESVFMKNRYSVAVQIKTVDVLGTHTVTIRGRHLNRFWEEILHVKIDRSGEFEYWGEAPNGDAIRLEPLLAGGPYRERRRSW